MALLLNIDTATGIASVCVSRDGISLAFRESYEQREHASFVHAAIQSILKEAGVSLKEIEAFSVTSGPGSYTGLRVAMATAKGFCYAFSKPLITVNTLEVMVKAALDQLGEIGEADLLCPMIDARRLEVFTALYERDLTNVLTPRAVVLEEKSFDKFMTKGKVVFFGNGSSKYEPINVSQNAVFEQVEYNAKNLASLADKAFHHGTFTDLTYSQPDYLKEFHSNG